MVRQRRDPEREAFWREALGRYAASGMSVRAFCQRERLTESAFYAWRRTIAQRDGDRRQRGTPGRPNFLPLRVTHHAAPDSSISIELAGGRVLRLPDSTSPERLAALIHALEARATG
jgi:transposase-like protein